MKAQNLSEAISVFFLAAGLTLASVANAEDLYFKLINQTSVDIDEFYVSPTGVDDWEDNLLDGEHIPAGYEVMVTLSDGREICSYDISAQFADGEALTDYRLDLCEMGEYIFDE